MESAQHDDGGCRCVWWGHVRMMRRSCMWRRCSPVTGYEYVRRNMLRCCGHVVGVLIRDLMACALRTYADATWRTCSVGIGCVGLRTMIVEVARPCGILSGRSYYMWDWMECITLSL